MRVLGIETSGAVGSVCLAEDEKIIAQHTLRALMGHSRDLVVCLDAVCEQAGWNPMRDIELIAVSQGPGSYTGLRVAAACVKAIAYAARCNIVGVCSLDVLAQNALVAFEKDSRLSDVVDVYVSIDAKRGEVYSGSYERRNTGVERKGDIALVAREELLRQLKPPALLIGDGLADRTELTDAGFMFADRALWWGRAEVVARMGLAAYRAGKREDPLRFTPTYMRQPEAEEKRLKKIGQN